MKELHLARSVQALKDLAQKNIKNIKHDKLYNSAEKLFQTGLQTLNDGDEEKAYILFVRFILIYKFLDEGSDDKRYTKQRLGREYATISEQLSRLEASLNSRYENQKKEVIAPVAIEPPKLEVETSAPTILFPNGYVSCGELYNLINNKLDIVILDSRPRDDYLQSSMKHPCCVNIPEEIIQSGSSANTLGKQVPNDSQSQWDRRWKSSLTVLLDWSSTKDTITASKLSVLRDILIQWDTTMVDSNPPVVLNGGYLEWLQMYPMLCTNPDVVYEVQNSVLNDLLDLDLIEYPSTEDTTPARYLKPPSLQPAINRATKPVPVNKDKNIVKQNEEAADLEDIRMKRNLEAEEGMRFELQQREEKLLEDNAALEKSKQELNEENEQLRRQILSITSTADSEKPKSTLRKNENDIRDRLLLEAREKKKSVIPDTSLIPTIRIKVAEYEKKMRQSGKVVVPAGLTGLVNMGSTCYMNSVIQCYSNTRLMHNFFLYGLHTTGEPFTDKLGDVSTELKNVLSRLWAGHFKCISPTKFKASVDRYGPRFKGRDQQDAHEFLVTLNTWLHDELKRDTKRPRQVIWTPKQKNWVTCTEGKTSVIIETFCGQQMNIINCDECKKRKEKLEVFEDMALALPKQDFCTLEDCLNQYYSKQQIHDYNCQTCKSNKLVHMQMKLVGHPPVLVLCLKRFTEALVDGRYKFVKNMVSVKYPLVNLNIFGATYNLYAVIVHRTSGMTLDSGHYYSIVKNLCNGKWYKYDDNYVTEVSRNEALEPIDAYVLFYQSEAEEKLAREQFKQN